MVAGAAAAAPIEREAIEGKTVRPKASWAQRWTKVRRSREIGDWLTLPEVRCRPVGVNRLTAPKRGNYGEIPDAGGGHTACSPCVAIAGHDTMCPEFGAK